MEQYKYKQSDALFLPIKLAKIVKIWKYPSLQRNSILKHCQWECKLVYPVSFSGCIVFHEWGEQNLPNQSSCIGI